VSVDDHIRIGILLGKFSLELAMTTHRPEQKEDHIIQKPLPDADVPVRQSDPDAIDLMMAFHRQTVAHKPVTVALDGVGWRDL